MRVKRQWMIILTDKTNVTGFSNVVLENKLESGGKLELIKNLLVKS